MPKMAFQYKRMLDKMLLKKISSTSRPILTNSALFVTNCLDNLTNEISLWICSVPPTMRPQSQWQLVDATVIQIHNVTRCWNPYLFFSLHTSTHYHPQFPAERLAYFIFLQPLCNMILFQNTDKTSQKNPPNYLGGPGFPVNTHAFRK